MSSELERRLEGLFAEGPEPDPGAEAETLHRALRALRPVATSHRGLRAGVLAFAGVVVLLVIAAGSLAAAGALHVSIGAKAKPKPPATAQLSLPKGAGASGIAAIVNGRLSVVIKGGFGLQASATAAALSPHALYVAAGIRHSLVAIAPSGRHAFSHPAGGRVVAIAWAPDGFRIAYVVHSGRHFLLRAIYGNGRHDELIDSSVRPVRPSWRADSLAFAYVGAGGKAIVYDLGHQSRSIVGRPAPVTRLVFAPTGSKLLVATPGAAFLGRKTVATGEIEAIGWLQDRAAVAVESGMTEPLVRTFAPSGRPLEAFRVPGRVLGVTGGLVVARTTTKILAGWRTKRVSTILGVKNATVVEDLEIG